MLTVLNCCLAQSLRDVKRRRQRITSGGVSVHRKLATSTAAAAVTGKRAGRGGAGKQRENITTMVVAVIFVFIFCELPDVALRLAVTAVGLEVRSVSLRLQFR